MFGFCSECEECACFDSIIEQCKNAYVFSKRKEVLYQPTFWKVFTHTFRDDIHFRLEIFAVVECK